MKKLISLALILAVLCTMAFALDNKVNVVGTYGGANGIDNGFTADNFTPGAGSVEVEIKVNAGAYESRYAVDIEYNDISFTVTGANMIWDVNELQYVADSGVEFAAPAAQTITVKNYSDKAVGVAANVDEQPVLTESPMTVTAAVANATVSAATAKNGSTPGTPGETTVTISVGLKPDKSWNDVATYFAGKLGVASEMPIGTVELTFSKV